MIAKFVTPGDNEPSGFILTTILGIVGAFVATYLGQAIGWYRADEGAGLIGAVVGAIIILVIWGFIAGRRSPTSPGRSATAAHGSPRTPRFCTASTLTVGLLLDRGVHPRALMAACGLVALFPLAYWISAQSAFRVTEGRATE